MTDAGALRLSRRDSRRALLFVGVSVALLMAAGLAWIWYSNRARLDESQNIRAARTVGLFHLLLQRQVQAGQSLMRAIVESRAVQEALDQNSQGLTITALQALRADFASLSVVIYRPDGRPIAWSNPLAMVSLGAIDRSPTDAEPSVQTDFVSGDLSVVLSQPIDVDGRLVGRARVAVRIGRLFIEQSTRDLEAPLALYQNGVPVHYTFPETPPPPPHADTPPEPGEVLFQRAEFRSDRFDVGYLPARLIGGDVWLGAGMPRSADERRLARFVLANAVLAGAGLIVLLASLGAYLRITEQRQRLADQRDAAVQRSAGLSDRLAHLAAVVHDIKAPVSGIQLRCEGLLEETRDPALHSALDQITDTCERLNLYLANVLTAAQVEEGPIRPHRTTLLVPGLIEEAVDRVGPLAARRGVTLDREVAEGLPAISADAVFLERALQNLAINAIAATPAGGSVTLFASRGRDALVLGVRDTGPGFRGFEPENAFSRERPQVKDHSLRSGTGLGLYIVARIAEAHGGRAEAENRREGGAEVRIVLPLSEE